jgi:dTDP-4-amino-4,6-dideoxygalactose transaminase
MMSSELRGGFKVVDMFEQQVAEYTGAPFAVATDSCTSALLLCCAYTKVDDVKIPSNTYVSVPNSIVHAGGTVTFEDLEWQGLYQLKPYPIYDSAKRFTSNMYIPGSFMCLSFHTKKLLPIGRGGMILTDNEDAVAWLKKARYDGRTEGVDLKEEIFETVGWNCYMTPEQAARGIQLLALYPENNEDPPIENYGDLSKFESLWKGRKCE